MTYLEGQIVQRQGYITLWHTRIVSGEYKTRKIFITRDGKERPMNEEELLKDAISILQRHVELLGELIEHLPQNKLE